jgi:LmbE family N-acetylglucosaminyl deacetylase
VLVGRLQQGSARVPVLVEAEVGRVLVVVSHPDDAEFWLGGTIAKWTGAGVGVTYCVLTDGEAGGFDPAVPRAEVPGIRRAEQERAAAVLGVSDVSFLGVREGELQPGNGDLHRELVRLIRRVRPQRVVTWSPEWNWQRFRSCHPDHLATGTLTLQAIYPDAGNPFAVTGLRDGEELEAWTVREAWLINSPAREVNRYVDVTGVFDRKVAAVQAHESQVGNRSDLAGELRRRSAANSAQAGLEPGRLAEAFQIVVTG